MSEHEEQATSIPGLEHGQLCYLQIPAREPETSARFYERVLGWRIDPPSEFEAPALIGQWVTDRPPAPEAGPLGWFHVDDIRRTLRRAEQAGATGCEGPIPDGPRELAWFRDPAGNVVGLASHGGGPAGGASSGTVTHNRTMPPCTVIPQLVYDDVPAAIEWLCDRFGFRERWRVGGHRAQLSFGAGTVVVAERSTASDLPGPQSVLVRVPDARAHHERASRRGAQIVAQPRDFPYGERQYTARDLGGHHWTFSQSIADLAPEVWGGTSGPALVDAPAAGAASLAQEAIAARTLVSAMLIVPDAAAAVDWYKRALGARELWDLGGVAGLEVGGAPFFVHEVNPRNLNETSPARAGLTSTRIELFVEDPDAIRARALAAGATPGSEMADREVPWGTHRQGGFVDPFGHNWSIGDRTPLQRLGA